MVGFRAASIPRLVRSGEYKLKFELLDKIGCGSTVVAPRRLASWAGRFLHCAGKTEATLKRPTSLLQFEFRLDGGGRGSSHWCSCSVPKLRQLREVFTLSTLFDPKVNWLSSIQCRFHQCLRGVFDYQRNAFPIHPDNSETRKLGEIGLVFVPPPIVCALF